MSLLAPRSLAATLDKVDEMLFFERRIPKAEARRVARFARDRRRLARSIFEGGGGAGWVANSSVRGQPRLGPRLSTGRSA